MAKGMQFESVTELASIIAKDDGLRKKIQENPVEAIAAVTPPQPPLIYDEWIYRIVVLALGSLALVAAIGAIILAIVSKAIPEVFLALGSGAVRALAGLFAPSPAQRT